MADHEARIAALAFLLLDEGMTVREIQEAFAASNGHTDYLPAAATIYARIEALSAHGYVVKKQKRRGKIPGKSGQRERVYSIVNANGGSRCRPK